MKILYVSDPRTTFSNLDLVGSTNAMMTLAREFKADVIGIKDDIDHAYPSNFICAKSKRKDLQGLIENVSEIANNYDIIHFYCASSSIGRYLDTVKFPKPVVFTMTVPPVLSFINHTYREHYQRIAYDPNIHMVFVSKWCRDAYIEELDIEIEKIQGTYMTIYEGYDDISTMEKDSTITLPEKYFVIVGRLTPSKNIVPCLKSIQCTKLPAVLIGADWGDDEYRVEVKKAFRYGTDVWFPALSRSQCRDVMRRAEALICLSELEAAIRILLESALSGTPVLTWDKFPSLKELADYIPSPSICIKYEEIKRKRWESRYQLIGDHLNSLVGKRQLIDDAVRDRFSVPTAIRIHEKMYMNVLSGGPFMNQRSNNI